MNLNANLAEYAVGISTFVGDACSADVITLPLAVLISVEFRCVTMAADCVLVRRKRAERGQRWIACGGIDDV